MNAFESLKTFSAVGKEAEVLEAGREVEIFRRAGKGVLTHMWFALNEQVRVRVYVDDEASASIDMALDLGHGYGFGGSPAPSGSPRMGRYGGQFNTYHIPYGSGVRVTLLPMTQDFGTVTGRKVWWIIRGTENLPLVVAGQTLPESARLRLHRLEAYEAAPLEEFPVCDVGGRGLLFLVVLAAQGLRQSGNLDADLSYMEGDVRAYLDAASEATHLSSGLEDYFLGSGYFHQNLTYWGAVAGLTSLDKDARSFSAYRFHEDDPVFFHQGLRLTLRNGEQVDGKTVGDPPPTRYSTYVWLYQW